MDANIKFTELPDPPKDLSGNAAEVWNDLGTTLLEKGKLTKGNLDIFSDLCFWEDQKFEAMLQLQGNPSKPISENGGKPKATLLLSNIRAIQNEINRRRTLLGLEPKKPEDISNTPLIPDEVYHHLPAQIRNCCRYIDQKRYRDSFLVLSLPVMASHLRNVLVDHADGYYAPDQFVFVINDKNLPNRYIKKAAEIGSVLNKHFLKKTGKGYQALTFSLQSDKERFQQAFYQNNGKGLIFETNLENALKSDFLETGFYSYITQKALAHEPVTVNINQQNKFIEHLSLSVGLYGSFEQVENISELIGKENITGYSLYAFEDAGGWQSHQPTVQSRKLNEAVEQASEKNYLLFNALNKREKPLKVDLKHEQWQMIDETFAEKMEIIEELKLPRMVQAANQHSAVTTLKLAALFSVLRNFAIDPDSITDVKSISPSESDMIAALWLSDTFIKHAIRLYQYLPVSDTQSIKGERFDRFYAILPAKFKASKALKIAEKLSIPERSARRYLSSFVKEKKLRRLKKGVYQKL